MADEYWVIKRVSDGAYLSRPGYPNFWTNDRFEARRWPYRPAGALSDLVMMGHETHRIVHVTVRRSKKRVRVKDEENVPISRLNLRDTPQGEWAHSDMEWPSDPPKTEAKTTNENRTPGPSEVIRPIYDQDGAPLCSTSCQYYTIDRVGGKRCEYCAHPNAPDPSDDWCRPTVVRWAKIIRSHSETGRR